MSRRIKAVFMVIYAVNIAIIVIWTLNWCFMPAYQAEAYTLPVIRENAPISEFETICKATKGENCDVIYNLCKAESGCKKYAVNKNKNSSFDYSYFQINSLHIKGIGKKGNLDMSCVYSLPCISQWVNEQIKAGRGNIWVAWKKI